MVASKSPARCLLPFCFIVLTTLQAKAVQDYVQLLLDNGTKFLIFAHHTVLLDAIEHVSCWLRACLVRGCTTCHQD